ncbi:MAG TPA: glycosyltransferase family 39 protein [Methylomirabilota bacterium]|nr:glycosyltransferase family 39 protein [Methylomirabilota bacterium]
MSKTRALLVVARQEWSLLLAALVALALRTQQLGGQILVGDEWHALEKAASAPYGEIATTLGTADHSIPIALYYRAVSDTFGLSEVWIRAPFLLAGLATVVGLSLAARRFVERATSDVFAWLLAVSPVLVFYSRFARPYALTCLLAMAALLSFHSWWRERRRRPAILYALAVAFGGYLHSAVLPFVLAPLPFFFLRALRADPETRRAGVRALFGIASMTGAALALLLLPPFLLDPEGLGRHSGWGLPVAGTVLRALRIFAGTDGAFVALALFLPAVVGLVSLARRASEVTALFAIAGALQFAAVFFIAPAHRSDVFAFARYLLPLLPPALLAVACGVRVLLLWIPAHSRALAGPLLGGWLLAVGPLPATWTRPDNWAANHLAFGILGRQDTLADGVPHVPDFYLRLLDSPPRSLTLVEAPWFPPIFANPQPYYQRLHRQRVRIGFLSAPDSGPKRGELPWPASGFALHNFLFIEELLGPGTPTADYLVLHRDLRREYDLNSAPVLIELADEQHRDIAPLVERCRQRFGAPEFEDEWVVVFRLR